MFPCDSLRLQGLSADVPRKSDRSAGALDADDTEGLLAGLFAEENEFDRRALWRIGSWGVVAVGAVVVAVYSNQSALGWRRDQIAADDFARQAQQIRQLARENQVEARKLASAVDTLNGDRDRLYSRVTVLEQGLDSVTGAIAKQGAAKPVVASSVPDGQPATAQPAPAVGPIATAPAASAPASAVDKPRTEAAKPDPQVTITSAVPAPAPAPAPPPAALAVTKSMMGPPDPAAPKLIEAPRAAAEAPPAATAVPAPTASPKPETLASVPAEEKDEAAEESRTAVQRTEFAVDLGSANSVGGLRALWRTVVASNAALKALTPIITVRENRTGLGMQLRLAAGPLQDAATAAKICAALTAAKRGCETTVYDGQRLAMAGAVQPLPSAKPEEAATKPVPAKRAWTRHSNKDEPPAKEESKSAISSWFSKKP